MSDYTNAFGCNAAEALDSDQNLDLTFRDLAVPHPRNKMERRGHHGQKHKYAVANVLSRISSTARKAALHLHPAVFEVSRGVQKWLNNLANLQMKQKTSLQAIAIVEKYFGLAWLPHGRVGEHLGPEKNAHQEFEEPLDKLYRETVHDSLVESEEPAAMPCATDGTETQQPGPAPEVWGKSPFPGRSLLTSASVF